jgi:periplasmic protein CpxP/Spy
MKIFKSLAFRGGLAFITANVSAQAPSGGKQQMDPQQMAQKMTDHVKQNVTGITPDQESKILAAEQTFTKGMEAARNTSNGDRDAMKSQMQPLKDNRDAQIKTILTADQYAQYQKMEASHQSGHGNGGGNSGN